MSPKPTEKQIRLFGTLLGIAEHFPWEEETLIDYLAQRIKIMAECIDEETETGCQPGERADILELCAIAKIIAQHPNVGLESNIEISRSEFDDLRAFVAWRKQELADYMIHQVVALGLADQMKGSAHHHITDEIHEIAFQIYFHKDEEGVKKADERWEWTKRNREHDAIQAAAKAAAQAATSKPVAGKKGRKTA